MSHAYIQNIKKLTKLMIESNNLFNQKGFRHFYNNFEEIHLLFKQYIDLETPNFNTEEELDIQKKFSSVLREYSINTKASEKLCNIIISSAKSGIATNIQESYGYDDSGLLINEHQILQRAPAIVTNNKV